MTVIPFIERAPSTAWEVLQIPGADDAACWVWFRPQHLPFGVAVTVPPELIGDPRDPLPFSLFHLVHAVGLPWEALESVSLYGREWQPASFWDTMAGELLPVPTDGSRSQILLMTRDSSVAIPQSHPVASAPVAASISGSRAPVATSSQFSRLETDWKACQGMERQLSGLRQQLAGVVSRLSTLDRDLRPQERLAADRQQKDEWDDARRWIRDVSAKVQRCIKAHDIGITSAAGRRNLIQDRYEQSVANAGAVGDLTSCLHDVEAYRKELANLYNNMGSSLQGANTNGIQRAQRILSKIAAQVTKKRAKQRGQS